jgi:hypothetical protein
MRVTSRRSIAGLAAGGIAVLLKAPLMVVIVVAAVTAALLRAIG